MPLSHRQVAQIRSIKAAAAVYVALLMSGGPEAETDLAAALSTHPHTVRRHLRDLQAQGIVTRLSRYGGWILTTAGRQLAIPLRLADGLDIDPVDETGTRESRAQDDSQINEVTPVRAQNESERANRALDHESKTQTQKTFLNLTETESTAVVTARMIQACTDLFGEPVLIDPAEVKDPYLLLAWIIQAHHQRKRLHHPARLVCARVRSKKPPDPGYRTCPTNLLPPSFLTACGLAPDKAAGRIDPEPPAPDEVIDVDARDPDPAADLPTAAATAWRHTLDQLRADMPKAAYDTWLDGAQLVTYDDQANAFTIQAKTAYTAEWLNSRLKSTVERILTGICARETKVSFVSPTEEES